jgi:hypothetical protein
LGTADSGESGAPPRHPSNLLQNVADPLAHGIKSVRGIHHEIRAPALFGIGQLPGEDGVSASDVMVPPAMMRSR